MPADTTLPSTFSAKNEERHQYKPGQGCQLELDQGDKKLNRQHEETQNHNQPGNKHDDDGIDIHKYFGESRHIANLFEYWRTRVNVGFG